MPRKKYIQEKTDNIKYLFKGYKGGADIDVIQKDIRAGKGFMLVRRNKDTGALTELTWFFDTIDDLERFAIYFTVKRKQIENELNNE